MAAANGLEIERKWLLRKPPSPARLARLKATPLLIEQVYLTNDPADVVRRLRRVERPGGSVSYIFTAKRVLRSRVREEREWELNIKQYIDLAMNEADPERAWIRKTRWVFEHAGHTFELDIFSEPRKLVLLECELADADEAIELPPHLAIEREVTDEVAYGNHALSRRS